MALKATDYPRTGNGPRYAGYFEIIHAGDPGLAKNCHCEVGQYVGRVYSTAGGDTFETVGTLDEVEAAVATHMTSLKVA